MAGATTPTTTVRAHEHDTLAGLCHRHLGRTAGTVEATLAAGPINTHYPRGDKPVMALIQELTARNDYGYIHLEKKGFSLTLHKEIRK